MLIYTRDRGYIIATTKKHCYIQSRYCYEDELNERKIWLDACIGKTNYWSYQSIDGGYYVRFDSEEDKCLFLLKFGDVVHQERGSDIAFVESLFGDTT